MKRLLARLEGFSVVRPIDQPPGQSWSRVAPADAPTMRAARMMHSSLTLSMTYLVRESRNMEGVPGQRELVRSAPWPAVSAWERAWPPL